MPIPIRARLTIVAGALTAAVLVALGAFVYVQFESYLLEAVDEGLRTRAEVILATPDGEIPPGDPLDASEAPAQIIDASGELQASTVGFEDPQPPPPGVAAVEGAYLYDGSFPTDAGSVPLRLIAILDQDGNLLILGASLEDSADALASLASLLLVGGPVAIALTSLVGWLVAGAALRPVERLRTEAEVISAAEPGRRLPVPATGDELARLAEGLNRMLARLEEAVERERRFVSDASHELRTPLANLKAELDIALRRARGPEELTRVLHSASEETDRLGRLADDLLVLARAEGGRLPIRCERVDLDELVRDIVASFASRAREARIDLEAAGAQALSAEVDPVRVRQAAVNLVDNAVVHTPAGGRVTVMVESLDGAAIVRVSDSGPGFPPGFLDRAFEPFSRADAARSRRGGGAGLGLAIVQAIAEAHGGSVEAHNRPEGGAEVVLRLPPPRA